MKTNKNLKNFAEEMHENYTIYSAIHMKTGIVKPKKLV